MSRLKVYGFSGNYYLKSEADEVLAEKDKEIAKLKADYKEACDRLQTANLIKDEQKAKADELLMKVSGLDISAYSPEEVQELQDALHEVAKGFSGQRYTTENRAQMAIKLNEAGRAWLMNHPPKVTVNRRD